MKKTVTTKYTLDEPESIASDASFMEAFTNYYLAVSDVATARKGNKDDEKPKFQALEFLESATEQSLISIIDAYCAYRIASSLSGLVHPRSERTPR